MYIHLGKDVSIKSQDIIGIFDIDNTSISKITRDFLSAAEKSGKITSVTEDIPKSFILSGKSDDHKIYLSQLASSTLKKRALVGKRQKSGISLQLI